MNQQKLTLFAAKGGNVSEDFSEWLRWLEDERNHIFDRGMPIDLRRALIGNGNATVGRITWDTIFVPTLRQIRPVFDAVATAMLLMEKQELEEGVTEE